MRKIIAFCALGLFAFAAYAQKKPLAIADFANWYRMENRQISFDAKFVAYEIKKQKGDGMLIVYDATKQTNDTVFHAYEAKFSADASFIAYKIRLPEDTIRKHKLAKTKKENMPQESVGVLNLKTKEKTVFEKAKRFAMPTENVNWLAVQRIKPKNPNDTIKSKSKARAPKETNELVLWQPESGVKHTIARIDTFVVAEKGERIIARVLLNDTSKLKALISIMPNSFRVDTLSKDSSTIKRLTLDAEGKQLAYLASNDTAKNKTFELFYTDFNKRQLRKIADTQTKGLAKDWSPSEFANIYFSKNGSKLFFGMAPKPVNEPKDTLTDDEKPRLDLWSHTDDVIQPMQLVQRARRSRQSYLALYRIADNTFVTVADKVYENAQLCSDNNADIALITNSQPYQRSIVWSSRRLWDYVLVDLKTGTRRELKTAANGLSLSSTGRYSLWLNHEDKQIYAIDNKTLKQINLTQGIAVSFVDELNDTPNDALPYGMAGWLENDAFVLVYDRYDIWQLDPTGKQKPLLLTNGRQRATRYRYVKTNDELNHIPAKTNMLMSAFNEKTNVEAYYELQTNNNVLTKLVEGDFMLGSVQKAKNAEAYIWSTQTVKDFPEIKLSITKFENTRTISNSNPQQSDFYWPTVEVVEWVSFAGDSLKGMLYKPENFDPNKKYPVVTYFYERSSDNLHRYNYPQPSRSIISIPFYVSNDYLVFVPDIVYTTGYPGQNAYDCIVSGVQKLINTRTYVDGAKIGLQGQSWGGYQIAYLITQTNMFAAAMAGAPVSNMTSAYGGIRWGTGMSRMFQYEETQSRIGGTLWERPLLYLENSPLFHAPKVQTPLFIMANDNDGAVPWYQGIEFFMALYRLQKPVWMINYNGMDHNIENRFWANRVDLSTRMFGFFNHYLKGYPAPEWMTKGIPATEKGKTLGY